MPTLKESLADSSIFLLLRQIAGAQVKTERFVTNTFFASAFSFLVIHVGTELAQERPRCPEASDRFGHQPNDSFFTRKGYDDERSHKGKIHAGAPIAERLPRNEFGGSGDGGICGTDCECSGEGKHAKGRTRSFL
jgi:hypothetical protein